MDHGRRTRLGEFLVEKGLISEEDLKKALSEQAKTKKLLGEVLVSKGCISARELLQALSEHFGIPLTKLKDRYIDWDTVTRFSPSLIMEHRFFPIESDNFCVTVAVTDPLDAWGLKKLDEEARELIPRIALTSEEDMDEAIERYKMFMKDRLDSMI